MNKFCFLTLAIIGLSNVSNAQYYDKTYALAIDFNIPVSNTNYVDQISTRGIKLGYREMINERVFGGFDFSNSTYNRHVPRRTYASGTSAITTDLFNYAYSYGLTLAGEYYFRIEKRIMPYAGFGIGASYINYRQFFNVYSNQSDSWGVLIRPHAGVQIRLKENSKWAFQAALHFDYSSAKSADFELKAFTNLGLQVGVIFLSW